MNLQYIDGQLTWEGLSLAELKQLGTPLYVYSEAALRQNARAYLDALNSINGQGHICYAVKANGHPEIIKIFAEMGLGADVTSGGELYLARQGGIPAGDIIYSGVGKSAEEIRLAIKEGIRALHIESEAEFELVAAIASQQQCRVNVAIRINPNVAAATHPYISTGGKHDKFGVNGDLAAALMRRAHEAEWLVPIGLAIHIGSQITLLSPFSEAIRIIIDMANALRNEGIAIRYLDIGGGLGINYKETPPSPADWVTTMAEPVVAAGYEVAMEPGRSLVGKAGLLLTRVEYRKQQDEKKFVIVDAGMNDLIRPTLYQAHHPILPVQENPDTAVETVNIVGPVCESGDFLAKERQLPPLQSGDLIAVTHAGAYGFAMSSNYNGRLRPAEVLINGNQFRIIRKRQTFADLIPAV